MAEVNERLDKVESRLGGVEHEVGALRGEVGELRGKVDGLMQEVHTLRMLKEDNAQRIRLIAEVQALHGVQLETITKALEPLAALDAFVRTVAHDHERRLTEVEKRTGVRG